MAKLVKTDSCYKGIMLAYVLMAGSILLQAALVAALLGLITIRNQVRGTAYEGHYHWQLVSVIGGIAVIGVVAALYHTVSFQAAAIVGGIGMVWFLIRLVRGGMTFLSGDPITKPWTVL